MAAVMRFENFSYTHPGATAPVIRGLTLDIQAGSFVAIVGGSGVGKSTLLRAAAGLTEPGGGSVRFEARPKPGCRARAVVFQDSRLLPWRRVGANVAYGLEGLGLSGEEKRRRARQALALTGMEGLDDRWPHQLSGGQAQRVGIARAIARCRTLPRTWRKSPISSNMPDLLRVLIHAPTADALRRARNNAANLLKADPHAAVEIVVNAAGVAAALADPHATDARLRVCANTLLATGTQAPPNLTIVPAAILYLAQKQAEDWAYIRA
ncbi:ATP-binding cassette domain-containing protein [Bordetella holmesii]|nr:ATP-binding cassette domain-containing protein [Bordetella holmesii]AMD44753.1 hypothetical protein H558_04140 [Bordetella holmesii H558]AOB36853.1 hypothetical protein BBB42_15940 [Bordetella holmesii]AUL37494.1 hypothetical protein BTL52_16100 [Bordetella holmesii]AUL40797.1 hypothetical protein BTL53_16030 [Bordetella holmesii]AWP68217.1 hypothetical protein B7O97_15985 [Bordetella holmesii]